MPYDLSHWNNPRNTIANKYSQNDFAYVTHGATIALYVLERLNITASEAKQMTILDYGCGTGRAAFFLSRIFGKVIGYDPNTYCIREAHNENHKAEQHPKNLVFTSNWNDVPECDAAYSSNVIEHLNIVDAQVMIDNLTEKNKGRTLLWYSPENNPALEAFMNPEQWEPIMESVKAKKSRIHVDFFDFRQNS